MKSYVYFTSIFESPLVWRKRPIFFGRRSLTFLESNNSLCHCSIVCLFVRKKRSIFWFVLISFLFTKIKHRKIPKFWKENIKQWYGKNLVVWRAQPSSWTRQRLEYTTLLVISPCCGLRNLELLRFFMQRYHALHTYSSTNPQNFKFVWKGVFSFLVGLKQTENLSVFSFQNPNLFRKFVHFLFCFESFLMC
jgi:hypothetical protein